MSLFSYVSIGAHSSFAFILKRKRKLAALLVLSYRGIATVNVLWLIPTVPWVGLQCVIVVNPDHTHLLYGEDEFLFYSNCLNKILITFGEYV